MDYYGRLKETLSSMTDAACAADTNESVDRSLARSILQAAIGDLAARLAVDKKTFISADELSILANI